MVKAVLFGVHLALSHSNAARLCLVGTQKLPLLQQTVFVAQVVLHVCLLKNDITTVSISHITTILTKCLEYGASGLHIGMNLKLFNASVLFAKLAVLQKGAESQNSKELLDT